MDRMTTRIGLGLTRDEIRAVAVRRGRIVWTGEATREAGVPLADSVSALLRSVPAPRFPRPILSAAVGPHASQIKLIGGLPAVSDPAILSALIRENAGSFFRKNGVHLVTQCSTSIQPGEVIAMAIDEPEVLALREVCRTLHWRFGHVAPVPVAVMTSVLNPEFTWTDAGLAIDVTRTGTTITGLRTRRIDVPETPALTLQAVPLLASLGERGIRFADAFGAATMEKPALAAPLRGPSWDSRGLLRQVRLPAAVLGFGLGILALSPLGGVWATHQAREKSADVSADQRRTILVALGRLEWVSRVLQAATRFSNDRVLATPAFSELALTLPDETMLVSLERNERQVDLVALTPNPANVLAALERLPHVHSVELVGPVRREGYSGRELQRVTVRFTRERP